MIEEKEELQGQLIASGQIVGGLIGCKGEKGDKGDTGNSATITVGTVTTGSPGTQATVTNVGTSTDAIFDFVIPRGQDGSGGGGGGDMYKSTYDKNDNGIVDNAEKVNDHTVNSDVPVDAVFTDTTYTAGTGIEITAGNVINNTQTSAEWGNITGTISDQTDLKSALDNKGTYSKPSGGIPKTDLANAVQTSLGKADTAIQSSDLSTVATSGSYNDLSNKPTIPTKVSDLTNDSGFINKNVNDLTNYTTTSVINTLLAGKENDIPIQDTAPQDPEENDLWIDTSGGEGTNIVDLIFPVGSIVIKADNEDYSNWLGFTWERTLVGRVAVGINSSDTDFDTIGETGGEKTHTLTTQEMPSHDHAGLRWIGNNNYPISLNQGSASSGYQLQYNATANPFSEGTINTNTTGGGQAHNNLQPYQVVAYWKRVS